MKYRATSLGLLIVGLVLLFQNDCKAQSVTLEFDTNIGAQKVCSATITTDCIQNFKAFRATNATAVPTPEVLLLTKPAINEARTQIPNVPISGFGQQFYYVRTCAKVATGELCSQPSNIAATQTPILPATPGGLSIITQQSLNKK